MSKRVRFSVLVTCTISRGQYCVFYLYNKYITYACILLTLCKRRSQKTRSKANEKKYYSVLEKYFQKPLYKLRNMCYNYSRNGKGGRYGLH